MALKMRCVACPSAASSLHVCMACHSGAHARSHTHFPSQEDTLNTGRNTVSYNSELDAALDNLLKDMRAAEREKQKTKDDKEEDERAADVCHPRRELVRLETAPCLVYRTVY